MFSRKYMRLKDYGYSSNGCYFITICTKDRQPLLSKIVGGAVLSVPKIQLPDIGRVSESYLERMNIVLPNVSLLGYVIMPNHVHLLILIGGETEGAQRTAPPTGFVTARTKETIPRIVHGLKNVTTKKVGYSIWQRSYHDHIVRDEHDFLNIWNYIDENPLRWHNDCYYTE